MNGVIQSWTREFQREQRKPAEKTEVLIASSLHSGGGASHSHAVHNATNARFEESKYA
jgi:hypothetical protein